MLRPGPFIDAEVDMVRITSCTRTKTIINLPTIVYEAYTSLTDKALLTEENWYWYLWYIEFDISPGWVAVLAVANKRHYAAAQ